MEIHSVRQMLRTKSIYEIPLRVTYYARVSSESDEQLNSLGNQIAYYEEFIRKNPAWTYVPGYVDEGLSGISTRKRENFNRMIAESEEDRFDLVITKEISRFARNTLDSIQFTRQLLHNGVGVFFQNDNINTFDEDSELRLSIMSSIAQDELRKLSSRVRFGHQQAIKNNVVLGNGSMIGYRKENKRLVIHEGEAPIVRELFTLYATGSYSMRQIEEIFWKKGYRNSKGRRITHSTMSNMIANPKYKGYYVGNKVRIVDMFTKKQHFLPPEEWVMFKDETGDIVPALVSEELWEQANAVLRRRSEDVKQRRNSCQRTNLFTGKLFCTHCGTAFYMRSSTDKKGEKHNKWVCASKTEHGAESCPTFPLHEKELIPVLFDVFKDTGDVSASMAEEYEQMYRSLAGDGEVPQQIARQEGLLELARKKKEKLLELVALDSITPADFKAMTASCNEEMAKAEDALAELHRQQESGGEFAGHMQVLKKTLRDAQQDVARGSITREFVDTFIDKIFVTSEEKDKVRLDIRIFTGETTQKYLNKLKARASREGRPGHTFKEILPAFASVQMSTEIYGYCCSKLMRQELLDGIRFSENICFAEDLDLYVSICPKANSIYFDNKPYYRYLQATENSSMLTEVHKIDYCTHLLVQFKTYNRIKGMGYRYGENQGIYINRLYDDVFLHDTIRPSSAFASMQRKFAHFTYRVFQI